MSLLQSLHNIVRQHTDDLDKALSNPARDGHYAIEDASAELDKFESQLKGLVAQNITLAKKRDNAAADVTKFQTIATKAAQAQSADDVTAALTEKNRAQKTLDTLTAEIKANDGVIADAKQHIAVARAHIEEAKNTEEQAKTRIATANLRSNLASSTSNLSQNSALSKIDELQQAADAAEASAQAAEQLSSETPAAKAQSLEDKYSTNTSPVDDEAAALLAQFKK